MRPKLCLEEPLTFCAYGTAPSFMEYRYKHAQAMQKAKEKIDEIDRDFAEKFGRHWGGLIEEYRCDDAEVVLVAVGSAAGTVRAVVDAKREEGVKVGLVKLRAVRPFPHERLARVFKGKKGIGVIDRNVNFGWTSGTMHMEIKAVLGQMGEKIPLPGFIDGLAGSDITVDHIERAIAITLAASRGEAYQDTTWLALE